MQTIVTPMVALIILLVSNLFIYLIHKQVRNLWVCGVQGQSPPPDFLKCQCIDEKGVLNSRQIRN